MKKNNFIMPFMITSLYIYIVDSGNTEKEKTDSLLL